MNITILYAIIAVIFVMAITKVEADRDGDGHCPDTIRDMIRDGCKHLHRIFASRQKKLEQQATIDRVRRDSSNPMDDINETTIEVVNYGNFSVKYYLNASHQTVMKGPLYNGRRATDPAGAHLILNHRGAKMLRQSGEYDINARATVHRGVNGKLITDHTNRHRRNSNFVEKMAACCNSDTQCLVGFCFT